MDDVEIRRLVERGFADLRDEFRGRMDDWKEISAERHTENSGRLVDTIARLVRIEGEVRTTNGRVTRHDEQIRTLFARRTADKPADKPMDAESAPLTVTSAAVWVGFAVACIAATWFVLTAAMGFHR